MDDDEDDISECAYDTASDQLVAIMRRDGGGRRSARVVRVKVTWYDGVGMGSIFATTDLVSPPIPRVTASTTTWRRSAMGCDDRINGDYRDDRDDCVGGDAPFRRSGHRVHMGVVDDEKEVTTTTTTKPGGTMGSRPSTTMRRPMRGRIIAAPRPDNATSNGDHGHHDGGDDGAAAAGPFDEDDYSSLYARYLMPRTRTNVELAGGMTLRKQCRGRVIDQSGFRIFRSGIDALSRKDDRRGLYRSLCQLRDWEMNPRRLPMAFHDDAGGETNATRTSGKYSI